MFDIHKIKKQSMPKIPIPNFNSMNRPFTNINNKNMSNGQFMQKYQNNQSMWFKDSDRDGVKNMIDCYPFDKNRQGFTPARRQESEEQTAAKRFGQYNINQLQRLGQGRDRVVYALDKDKVLKVAKNPGGLTQNTQERYLDEMGQLKHYETGKDYVVMERVQPIQSKEAKSKLRELKKEASKHYFPIQDSVAFVQSDAWQKSGLPEDSEILNYSSDFLPKELAAKRQLGERDGNLVLIDAGALLDRPSIQRHTIKHYEQLHSVDRSRPKPWQLKEWQEVQQQRREYRYKGKPYERMEGASVEKQTEWDNKSESEKVTERITKLDTDGDKTPDEYDCVPNDPLQQHKRNRLWRQQVADRLPFIMSYEKNEKKNLKYKNLDFDKQNEKFISKEDLINIYAENPQLLELTETKPLRQSKGQKVNYIGNSEKYRIGENTAGLYTYKEIYIPNQKEKDINIGIQVANRLPKRRDVGFVLKHEYGHHLQTLDNQHEDLKKKNYDFFRQNANKDTINYFDIPMEKDADEKAEKDPRLQKPYQRLTAEQQGKLIQSLPGSSLEKQNELKGKSIPITDYVDSAEEIEDQEDEEVDPYHAMDETGHFIFDLKKSDYDKMTQQEKDKFNLEYKGE